MWDILRAMQAFRNFCIILVPFLQNLWLNEIKRVDFWILKIQSSSFLILSKLCREKSQFGLLLGSFVILILLFHPFIVRTFVKRSICVEIHVKHMQINFFKNWPLTNHASIIAKLLTNQFNSFANLLFSVRFQTRKREDSTFPWSRPWYH